MWTLSSAGTCVRTHLAIHTALYFCRKDSVVTQLFSTEVVNAFTCRCGEKMVRSVHSTSFDLNYRDCFPEGHYFGCLHICVINTEF